MGVSGNGQIGDGAAINRSVPTQVLGTGTWKILGDNGSSASVFNAGIKNDNTLWLWGYGNYTAQDADSSNKSSPVQILGGGTWTDVAQTERTGAAVKSDGTLWTWGDNYWGSIGRYGLSSSTIVRSPVQTTLGGSTWSKVAGGYGQIFAIKTDGTLWAWGANGGGTLGLGFIGGQGYGGMFSPVQVGTDTTWKMVGALYSGGIAIKQDNTLWIWGNNNNGQLGQGNIINRSSPVQVGTGTDWAFIPKTTSGITSAAFAIKNDGSLWGWGGNGNGQLAQNDTADRSSPVQIAGTWSKVTYTRSARGLKTDGSLWAWGHNSEGTIGDNTKIHRSSPVQTTLADTNWINVVGFGGIRGTTSTTTTTSTTSTSTTSTTSTTQAPGALYTWGNRPYGGAADNTGDVIYQSPTQAIDASQYQDLSFESTGLGSCFAIKPDGTLWAWGWNIYYGAIGDGTLENRSSPIQITSNTWNMVSSSSFATLAIRSDNTLWGWGYGPYLPNNSNTNYSSPIQIGTDTWRYVNSAGGNGAGIKTDGTLWCWGRNNKGQLGNNQVSYDIQSSPVQTVSGGNNWIFVSIGDETVHAIKSDSTLWAWGASTGGWGTIGNNTSYTEYSSPIQIGGSGWAFLSSYRYHVLATKTNGTLWAWGFNSYGELGLNNSGIAYSSPVQVGTDTNWKKPVAIDFSSGATKTDGTLWIWGSNYYNQTGNPDAGYALSSPVQSLANDNLWIDLSGNTYGFYATRSAGYVTTTPVPTTSTTTTTPQPGSFLGMGYNGYGEIGINSKDPKSFPTQEFTNSSWSKLPSGDLVYYDSSVGAIKKDGTLWTWGSIWDTNTNSLVHRSSPVQVSVGGTWTELSIVSTFVNAIKSDGTLWAWGKLPGNNNNSSPTQIGIDTDWKYVFRNLFVSAAIKNDDTAYLWGQDVGYGLWGDNTAGNTTKLVPTQTITGSWKMIVGSTSMLGIKTDGTLWSWGRNYSGMLGLNDTIQRSSPTQISGSYTYVSSDGYKSVMAVKSDGTLWGWGSGEAVINIAQQNGYPYSYQGYSSPVQLLASTGWTKVITTYDNGMALKSDGTIWSWGTNQYGNFGNGKKIPFYAFNNRFSPSQAIYTGWTDINSTRNTSFGLFG